MKNSKLIIQRDTARLAEIEQNPEWLYGIIENTVAHLEELRLWLKAWTRHSPDQIPGIDGYTSNYPEWPFTVHTIYCYRLDEEHPPRVLLQKDSLLSFLDSGVEEGVLVYRRYPEGCDWAVLNKIGYKELCFEFGFKVSDFEAKDNTRKYITIGGQDIPSRIFKGDK